ncbi:sigma-70 family RNA polymerase sigma factor [Paenibacillus sp. Dod16]|uniref:sigma-70 family RNA polymerase sigma factor n=1 Tax=unclassified Paenibacillus TaxID=185978 RepID=UPI003461E092
MFKINSAHNRTRIAVEKGFSSYVKSCLRHASRDFFKKLYYESAPLKPFDETSSDLYITLNIFDSPFVHAVEYASLFQAIQKLSPTEKKVLYMKFYKDMTDQEIASTFGVTRQAITKSKLLLLVRLRRYMD